MRTLLTIAALLLVINSRITAQSHKKDTVLVFYLGGQSNMDGYGFNKDLPKELKKVNKDVWIFTGKSAGDGDERGGLGLWAPLEPGFGVGFSSDGKKNKNGEPFWIELTFAKKMQELHPDKKKSH